MKNKVSLAIHCEGIRNSQKHLGRKGRHGIRVKEKKPLKSVLWLGHPASHENCQRSFLKTDTWALHPRGLAISGTESRISIFKKTIKFHWLV